MSPVTTVLLAFSVFVAIACEPSRSSHRSDESVAWHISAVGIPGQLKPRFKDQPLIIAIVDDGFRITHEELAPFVWQNPKEVPGNGKDDDNNGYVDDVNGWDVADNNSVVTPPPGREPFFYHGTHVAGVITSILTHAYGNEASRLVKLLPVKALEDKADKPYIKAGYKGIDYAIRAGAHVILCPWGEPRLTPPAAAVLNKAVAGGILVTSSAGNFQEGRAQYPAAHEGVLAVAGLAQNGEKAKRSNYGHFVDIAAPGEGIVSASSGGDAISELRDGTSMAAAIVSAAQLITKLQHPTYSPEAITACLKSGAHPLDDKNPRFAGQLGAGILDAKAAVDCSLFTKDTARETKMVAPQGYLHFEHPHLTEASWQIVPPEGTDRIRFQLIDRSAQKGGGFVEFYLGKAAEAVAVTGHSLADFPESVTIDGAPVWVSFRQEDGSPPARWTLGYRAEPKDISKQFCSGIQHVTSPGIIEDGSGAELYAWNSDCKWLVEAPEGQIIRFQFIHFDTEAHRDLLYFFNGKATNEKIMALFSGPRIPPSLTTWRNQALVWFVTDGQYQGNGWKAEISFVDK